MIEKRFSVAAAIAVLGFACSNCTSSPKPTEARVALAPSQFAIQRAEQALRRRSIPLPRSVRAEVIESEFIPEMAPPRPIYIVTFWRMDGKSKGRLYRVSINAHSGELESILDFRENPEGISR